MQPDQEERRLLCLGRRAVKEEDLDQGDHLPARQKRGRRDDGHVGGVRRQHESREHPGGEQGADVRGGGGRAIRQCADGQAHLGLLARFAHSMDCADSK